MTLRQRHVDHALADAGHPGADDRPPGAPVQLDQIAMTHTEAIGVGL